METTIFRDSRRAGTAVSGQSSSLPLLRESFGLSEANGNDQRLPNTEICVRSLITMLHLLLNILILLIHIFFIHAFDVIGKNQELMFIDRGGLLSQLLILHEEDDKKTLIKSIDKKTKLQSHA